MHWVLDCATIPSLHLAISFQHQWRMVPFIWLWDIIYVFLVSIRFNENIINDPGHMDIFPASHIPKKLHHLARPIYRTTSGAFGGSAWSMTNMKEKGFRLPTDPNTLSSILQWVSDAEVGTNYISMNLDDKACIKLYIVQPWFPKLLSVSCFLLSKIIFLLEWSAKFSQKLSIWHSDS